MSRRLHADAAALQTALDACTGVQYRQSRLYVSVSALIRAAALVRLLLGALLRTFDLLYCSTAAAA